MYIGALPKRRQFFLRMLGIMAVDSFLLFVNISKVGIFNFLFVSSIYKKLIMQVTRCHILQAYFRHYMSVNFQLILFDSVIPLCLHFFCKNSRCLYIPPLVFTSCFCRTIFLLLKFSLWENRRAFAVIQEDWYVGMVQGMFDCF